MPRTRKPRTTLSKRKQARVANMVDTITDNIKMDRRCQMDGCNNSAVLENLCDRCWQGLYTDVGGEDTNPTNITKALRQVQRDINDWMWGTGLDDDD